MRNGNIRSISSQRLQGGIFIILKGLQLHINHQRRSAQSISQLAHNVDAVVAFAAIALAPFLVSLGLNRDDRWHGYRSYSLITGFLAIGLFSIFSAAPLEYLGFVGLFQRLFLAVEFLWIQAVALQLLRISGHLPSLRR